MAQKTITLALDGEIPLADFASAMKHFDALIRTLSSEVASNVEIEWIVEDLHLGSAIATIRGEAEEETAIERVVIAYGSVGRALEAHAEIPYSEKVRREADGIVGLLDGHVRAVRFETPTEDHRIVSRAEGAEARKPIRYSLGAIKGEVETLTRRRGLRFIIYDPIFDRPVNCYLAKGQDDLMRDAWGKRVIVSGKIARDSFTGIPHSVREIRDVQVIGSRRPMDSAASARGILSAGASRELPEETVRRLRED